MVARSPRARRRRGGTLSPAVTLDDDLMRAYLRRLVARGTAKKGIDAYHYQLRTIARTAGRLAGCPVTLAELFRDATLLGRALVDDAGPTGGSRLSKWTLAQRRSAIRSFANLTRPELAPLLGEEPGRVVDRALQRVAERVGVGYRLGGGAPRRRGGVAPSREQVAALIEAVGRAPGFEGLRNRAFFGILALSGSRVNSLRLLGGDDCVFLPGGRLRVYLHEKGKAERREVELGAEAAGDVSAYVDAFNRRAATRGWKTRVRLGSPGAVWRNAAGQRWGYAAVVTTVRVGCDVVGIAPFPPHALRRAFATEAASRLPRHVVALAGGWKGLDRLDNHYVRPREPTIWERLSRHGERAENPADRAVATDAAAIDLR